MTQSVLRSLVAAIGALAIVGLAELTYFAALCPGHRAYTRSAADASAVVQDSGFGVARPGDAMFVCTTAHCVGPWCHEDRGCYCASPSLGAAALGAAIGGSCSLDKLQPTRADDIGACRRARCDEHID